MKISLSDFEQHVTSTILSRGRTYFRQQRVALLSRKDKVLQFGVIGTRPYKVQLTIENGAITQHSCNCPYDNGICKHEVACVLYIQAHLPELCKAENGNVLGISPTPNATKQDTDLSPTQTYLLCYMAYMGSAIGKLEIIKTPDKITINNATLGTHIKELLNKQWIMEKKIYRWGNEAYVIRPEKYFFISSLLLNQYSEWLAFFRKKVIQGTVGIFLMEVSRLTLGLQEEQMLNYTTAVFTQDQLNYIASALVPMAQTEQAVNVFPQLDFKLVAPTLVGLLTVAYHNDLIDQLTHVGTVLHTCSSSGDLMNMLRYRYRLYFFYFTGEELPSPARADTFVEAYYMKAAQMLYAGDADGAITAFQSGLKIQNSDSEIKNIPRDPISAMLYTIALATRRTSADLKDIQVMANKSMDLVRMRAQAVQPLMDFFKDSRQEVNQGTLAGIITNSAWNIDKAIGALSWLFMRCEGEVKMKQPPQCALLRKELSAYCPEIKADDWKYDGLLQRFGLRPSWEMRLEELITAAGGKVVTPTTVTTPETNLRLCYFYKGRGEEIEEVREQNRLQSGEWGKGKKLSWSRYQTGDCPMDELDKQIHDAWFGGLCKWQGQWPTMEVLLPFLKGTDKLCTSSYDYRLITYEVREEMPYIQTEKTDSAIVFSTNVPPKAMLSANLWFSNQGSAIVYYPLPYTARALFRNIIELQSLPLEAEPMLEQLFEALRGKVEIQSDIRGAVQLEQVEGNPQLIVRITPYRNEFEIRVVVRPLVGGECLCSLGKDKETIFDNREGKRVMVVRNLQQETANYIQWQQLLNENGIQLSVNDTLSAIDVLTLLEIAPRYAQLFVIEWPEGERINLHAVNTSQWQITTQGKGGWFELEGDFPIDENRVVTISELLNLLRKGKGRFIQLGERDYITLSDSLRRQLNHIDAVAQDTRGHLRVPEIGMAVMGDALNGEISIDFPKKVLTMRQRIAESANMDFEVPDTLNATLRDYQIDGYQWLMRLAHWGAGACLADDMGLGKTVQTIAFLLAHQSEGAQMVVAPASVVNNWQRELARFAPSLRVSILNDYAGSDREQVFRLLGAGDVLILTYGLLITEQDTIKATAWTTICLDEAHTIKNRETKSSAVVMQLNAAYRIILTGTPIQNHLGELWNLFQFINPGLLGSYEHFAERFLNPIAAGEDTPRQQLKRLIAPFLLRRTKQEVARELPDKVDVTIPVELSESEMTVYEVIRREAKQELENATSLTMNALAMITKLRMAACSAALAEKKWKGESSKLAAFTDKVMTIVEGGNRVLIFSQFTSFLTMARKELEKAGLTDCFYLDGQTPIKQRQKMVNDFQAGKMPVFLISLKAGGLGLNLTGANYVIHLDPWWNPAIEQQATDRAYRIGQQQKVTVYHLIAQHTIEEKIVRLHQTKRSLADSLLDGTNVSNRITPKELLQILEE